MSWSIFWPLGEGCGFLLLPSLYLWGGGIIGISSDVLGPGISMMSGNSFCHKLNESLDSVSLKLNLKKI